MVLANEWYCEPKLSPWYFAFMLRIMGAKTWIDFHIFMAIFALLWQCPYHNAELFVPILVWGHCAIFYGHFTTCFHESFFILSWTGWIAFICNFFYGKAYGISCDFPNARWIWHFKILLEKTIGIIRKQCTKYEERCDKVDTVTKSELNIDTSIIL